MTMRSEYPLVGGEEGKEEEGEITFIWHHLSAEAHSYCQAALSASASMPLFPATFPSPYHFSSPWSFSSCMV